jgi:hypothetical protein
MAIVSDARYPSAFYSREKSRALDISMRSKLCQSVDCTLYGCDRSATLKSMIGLQPAIFEPAGGPAQDLALALFGYQAGPGGSRLDLVLALLH